MSIVVCIVCVWTTLRACRDLPELAVVIFGLVGLAGFALGVLAQR